MSIKLSGISREDLEMLIALHELKPELTSQNPYIANGPHHEMLASVQPNGLYHIQLLDKKQVQESLDKTIRIFRDFAKAAGS
jgi:hypothetical protein